jgi:molecular chaperone GrpE
MKRVSAEDNAQVVEPETVTEPPAPAAKSEVDTLQEQLAAAKAEAQRYLDSWQRERADFINYKRRIERETKDANASAALAMLTHLLPIIDDFELAMNSIPQDLQGNPWLNGAQLVQRKFQKLLEENSVTVIDPLGEAFDASRHEAIMIEEDSAHESGHVTATLQKGYLAGDKVLRPARVKVAK